MDYAINHVHIRAKDPKVSALWYEKIFNAKIVSEREVMPGTITIGMQVYPYPGLALEPIYHVFDRGEKTTLVHRGAKIGDEIANFGVYRFDTRVDFPEIAFAGKRIASAHGLIQVVHLKAQGGDGLRQRVVQLVGERGSLIDECEVARLLIQTRLGDYHTEMAPHARQ